MTEKGIFFRLARKDDYYEEISAFVASLRKEGKLAKVLKGGLTLMWDLMNNRTDVLISYFPWIVESLCPPKTNNDDVLRKLDSMEREIQELKKQRPMQQEPEITDIRSHGFPAMAPKQSGAGIGTLAARTVEFTLPNLDDDELPQMTMKLAPLSSAKNGNNLLSGILGLD